MKKLKLFFLFIVVSMLSTSVDAQTSKTLIKESSDDATYEKKWRIEWGAFTGAGINSVFRPEVDPLMPMPEGMSAYTVNYAPRPEAELGFFSEVSKVGCIFSITTELSYTMRAVPQPVFSANNSRVNSYKSTYLNGLTFGALLNVKPMDKFKIGIGFDCTHFLITDQVENSNHAAYTQAYDSPFGLKTVFSYKVSPRVDIQMYARLGQIGDFDDQNMNIPEKPILDKIKPDDISAGMRVAYRICGKELHIKKQLKGEKKLYRLNY